MKIILSQTTVVQVVVPSCPTDQKLGGLNPSLLLYADSTLHASCHPLVCEWMRGHHKVLLWGGWKVLSRWSLGTSSRTHCDYMRVEWLCCSVCVCSARDERSVIMSWLVSLTSLWKRVNDKRRQQRQEYCAVRDSLEAKRNLCVSCCVAACVLILQRFRPLKRSWSKCAVVAR